MYSQTDSESRKCFLCTDFEIPDHISSMVFSVQFQLPKTGFLWLWNIRWWAMFRSKAICTLSQPLTTCRKVTYWSMWEWTHQKQTFKFWGLHNGIIEDSCLLDTFLQNISTYSPQKCRITPQKPKIPRNRLLLWLQWKWNFEILIQSELEI
jgi:hypothetical protein